MRKRNTAAHAGKLRSFGVVASVFLAPALLAGFAWPSSTTEPAPDVTRHVVRIEVNLKEFAISPDTLRIPAGQEVILVIKNDGIIPHEFMAGREATGGTFAHDLFADVEVEMSDVDPEAGEAGEPEHAEEAEHAEAGGHEHAAEAAGHDDAGEHGGEGHGTMITAAGGQTMYMSFTLPESKRGVWGTGCFLVGHYEAGMHGVLIVE